VIDIAWGPVQELLAATGAMALGSLFAAADEALSALPEPHLRALADGNSSGAAAFRRFTRDRQRILSRWLVGRIVCISFAAALAHDSAGDLGMTGARPLFAVLAAVATYGTLAEILGTLARRRAEKAGVLALRALRPLEWVLAPLAEPLSALGRFIGRRFPAERTVDARIAETEVEWVVSEGERSGALANEPAEMIRKVLDFKDLTAKEVMVPRRRILGIELSSSPEKVLAIVAGEGHSRYPVFKETLDNVVGLLYAKDLFAVVRDGKLHETKLTELLRTPVMFVSETQPAAKILPEMQSRRLHMAVVADEFGGTAGLITLEDIIEEIVGDIRDEYDTEAQVQRIGAGRIVADAAMSLTDLAEHLGHPLPATDGEYESLGGLIVHRAGRVPKVGATVELDGMKLIVREADATRVVKVEIVEEKGGALVEEKGGERAARA
jgi:CBS domain containing-hemolysin-like protein